MGLQWQTFTCRLPLGEATAGPSPSLSLGCPLGPLESLPSGCWGDWWGGGTGSGVLPPHWSLPSLPVSSLEGGRPVLSRYSGFHRLGAEASSYPRSPGRPGLGPVGSRCPPPSPKGTCQTTAAVSSHGHSSLVQGSFLVTGDQAYPGLTSWQAAGQVPTGVQEGQCPEVALELRPKPP